MHAVGSSRRPCPHWLEKSVDAVRKRIARGTLKSEKADGKVYVWLDDGAPRSDTDALISSKDETITLLREQLEAERQARAEARRIIAGLVERIPALEPSESPETPSEVAADTPPVPRSRRRPQTRVRGGGGSSVVTSS